jgi:hypothetical protein
MLWLSSPKETAASTEWIEGWVGPRASLGVVKEISPASAVNLILAVEFVASYFTD